MRVDLPSHTTICKQEVTGSIPVGSTDSEICRLLSRPPPRGKGRDPAHPFGMQARSAAVIRSCAVGGAGVG